MKAISLIVSELISEYNSGASPDVLKIKARICKSLGVPSAPKTMDILAAIPPEYKKKLQPLLVAKPIRSASGVRFNSIKLSFFCRLLSLL